MPQKIAQKMEKEVIIPENVNVEVQGSKVIVAGALGKAVKDFPSDIVTVEKRDNLIIISAKKSTKREKKTVGTFAAHIKNMILGVREGFEYKLQVCSVHFPISVSVDASKKFVVVKNFLGETKERKAKILENTEVKISSDIITVNSVDKEAASHTAANIETATRIKSRDRRVFQDGIFMTKKAGKDI